MIDDNSKVKAKNYESDGGGNGSIVFVKDLVHKYHFAAMAGYNAPYALIEGARGCSHQCTFCAQWRHWGGVCRMKSPERIADEIEFCYQKYGSRFIWLTDDDFGPRKRAKKLSEELLNISFRAILGNTEYLVVVFHALTNFTSQPCSIIITLDRAMLKSEFFNNINQSILHFL